jgi:hypothetical protein
MHSSEDFFFFFPLLFLHELADKTAKAQATRFFACFFFFDSCLLFFSTRVDLLAMFLLGLLGTMMLR